ADDDGADDGASAGTRAHAEPLSRVCWDAGGVIAARIPAAPSGPYAWVRHPQYTAFILIMFGFLLQWPTILMLLMFPVLVYMYLCLAGREEAEVHKTFGESYAHYAAITPAFFPRLRQTRTRTG
ncbi:MAG: isoprenylcysteine carboxylmethyltransferase family protein, partial [Gammaproteobacteria bacterium]|nr:isoprenylcysteine carboxylmethyltransferase family protein [Gammaproteobacteria bacterium]